MFSLLLKVVRRIKRILKVQSESRQPQRHSLRSRFNKVIILVGAVVLIAVLYPGESLYDPLDMPRQGEMAVGDIMAPFNIVVYKTDRELSDERELVRASVPFVIDADTSVAQRALTDMLAFLTMAESVRASAEDTSEAVADSLIGHVSRSHQYLSDTLVRATFRHQHLPAVRKHLEEICRQHVYRIGVLPNQVEIPQTRNKNVLIRRGERESIHPRDRVLTAAQMNLELWKTINRLSASDSIDVEYYYLLGRAFIRPNLTPNADEYERRLQKELKAINQVKEVVHGGDIVLRAGNRVTIRQERILAEMSRLLRTEAAKRGWLDSVIPVAVRIVLVFAAFASLYLFLYLFRRDIFNSNPKLLTLTLVFGLQLVLTYIASQQLELSIYLYPIAMLPIMVTILFDAEVGLLSVTVLAILLGILHRFNFTLALLTMVVGVVACVSSRPVRKRTDYLKITFFVALAYAIFVPLIETLKLAPSEDLSTLMGYGLVSGIVSAFVTIGVLPFFESIFGITTDIRLLELSDLNHPLLKRLALEAPGTYHHSIIIGNLAEAAAKEVGGNPLLARVGAYYHDIGKIEIPEYFVENQLSVKSKHEALTPAMSSVILSAHVKKGRVLGEMADIPDDVLDFIEEHHGTMVMSYFYNKAVEESAEEVSADKFRYPGPKPQTKETGIAMLADAVEAASRTLDEPKPARIHNLIQRIVDDRVRSGELDECPLTLRDLAKIREAFAQILIGAFHQRVAYPQKEKEERTRP